MSTSSRTQSATHRGIEFRRMSPGQWLILDNRTLTLVRDMDIRRAIPEFVFDDQGISRFVLSDRIRKATS